MTIEISSEIIQKLEHEIPEIRARAINNVQSKFQSCRVDLQDLIVNVNDLVQRLIKWFDLKPVTHEKQIFEILLTLLKSKYKSDAVRILTRYYKTGDLNRIRNHAKDAHLSEYFDEIISILSDYRLESPRSNHTTHQTTIDPPKPKQAHSPNLINDWDIKDVNENSCSVDGLQYEAVWEVPGQIEFKALAHLQTSISVKHSQPELDRALLYFEKYVYDFPGEFFLQKPFIFTNLLQLIESEINNFDHTTALSCCLKLIQNLSRRVTVRRVASMCMSSKEHATKQQVTIASFCFKTFQSVLNLLRNIYADSNLACINECFLILIEIVELICKSAGVYSTEIGIEYCIDQIIDELADFLRFIREMTSNYRRNGHKTNRNNSISILFLLCQLLMFKENGKQYEIENLDPETASKANESISDIDLSQRIRRLSLKNARKVFDDHIDSASNTTDDTASVSTLANYVTATEHLQDTIWRKELENALLDYPLKHFYPQMNDLVFYALKIDSLPDNHPVKVLMNLTELFEPVVTLLRDPKMCSSQQVLSYGLKSIDVLALVKSDELIHLLFNAITSLTPKYNSDDQLRESGEKLLLHMMIYGCVDMKRLIYKLVAEKMTSFFSSVMNGRQAIPKSYASTTNPTYLFGLPLTTDILIEVLCNGVSCEDRDTANHAENILLLVLRIKDVLPLRWNEVCKFLIPVLPLILCHAKTSSRVGSLILSVVEPEMKNELPTIVLLKSSVALLFSRETHTQAEAVYRLMYLIQNIPNAEIYMPNMRSISDTVPNNICIVEPMTCSSNDAFSCLYDVSLIEGFLDVLQNPHTEPSIRHSTLKQLNVIADDPVVLARFYEIDGHLVIWKVLDKSLQDASACNYAKNVIEIIGILCKLCIRIPSFRRDFEDDIQTYVLIMRSLLLFHTNEKFKRECAILLFSLAFSGYIVGGHKQFIVPSICKRLYLPIVCDYGWKLISDHHNLLDLLPINEHHPSKPISDTNSNYSCESSQASSLRSTMKTSQVWRYIRMSFSALWFGSLDHLIDCPQYLEGTKNTELNYRTNQDSLRFDKALCVTVCDLEIIEGSSQKYGLTYWLKQLKNATSTAHVALSCSAIENFSNVDSTGHRKQWDCNLFLQSIKRFCSVAPNTKQDEIVFTKMCRLLANLVERDFIDIHVWILKEFNRKSCIFLDLINYPKISTPVFLTNIKFMETILSKTIDNDSKRIIQQWVYTTTGEDKGTTSLNKGKSKTKSRNLYETLFDTALSRLDSLLEEKKMEELRSLVSLMQLLASSGQVQVNEYETTFASNKLLKLALAAASTSYVGSHFSRQCLLAIGNMMCHIDELHIENKYFTFLSTLCGHSDFQIRTYSWSILLKLASTSQGAELLVQEMNSLPGGIYACCLNTVLDDSEAAVVRENAALLFAALISHRKPNNEIDEKLYPRNAIGMGYEWIGYLIHHQDLIRKIIASVKFLYVKDVIDSKSCAIAYKIVPCNLMRSYCIILHHLLPLKGAGDVTDIFTATLQICKTIPLISQTVNQSSMLLLSEICELVSYCMSFKRSLIDQITRQLDIVQSLISFLNVDLFENISKPVKHGCWPNVLKLLRRLAVSPVGFQIICEAFAQNPELLEEAVCLFIYGLSSKDLNIQIMRFIVDLMIISQATSYPYETFAEQLNELRLSNKMKESTKKFMFNADISSQSVVNWFDSSDTDESGDGLCATEILYSQLAELFERLSDSSSIKHFPGGNRDKCFEYTCKSLETLLKCSDKARALATEDKFVLSIVEQMEEIYNHVGGSFTNFVRKSGNVKVEKFVCKLKLLLRMILCWFSVDCLQDEECTAPFIAACQKFWPSIGIDADLQNIFMKMLLFISNDSLPACKAISTTPQFTIGSNAFLHSIIEYCVAETSKPKTGQANLDILQMALKIVTNCCCCVEGRMIIFKSRMFHTLGRLHPQVTRNHKPWPQMTIIWLTSYEVFTRYPDSSKETNVNLLCNLADSPFKRIRHLALEILRNMTFNTDNRAALLSSSDFQRVMYSVLDKDEPGDEQLLIAVAIWKLVANNAKGKTAIKNSPIMSKLRALKDVLDRQNANQLKSHRYLNGYDANNSGDETTEELEVAVKCALDILQK